MYQDPSEPVPTPLPLTPSPTQVPATAPVVEQAPELDQTQHPSLAPEIPAPDPQLAGEPHPAPAVQPLPPEIVWHTPEPSQAAEPQAPQAAASVQHAPQVPQAAAPVQAPQAPQAPQAAAPPQAPQAPQVPQAAAPVHGPQAPQAAAPVHAPQTPQAAAPPQAPQAPQAAAPVHAPQTPQAAAPPHAPQAPQAPPAAAPPQTPQAAAPVHTPQVPHVAEPVHVPSAPAEAPASTTGGLQEMPQGAVSDDALPPEAADSAPSDGGASKRPSPLLLVLLAVVLVGFVAWKFVLNKDAAEPVAPPTPVTNAPSAAAPSAAAPSAAAPNEAAPSVAAAGNATSWAAAVPKTRPGGDTDANSIDAREVAPARFAHQVELARKAIKPGEDLLALRVQADGTLVALAGSGSTARWIATKKDLTPTPAPTAAGDALANLKPLTPADIQDRVPLKLLRAVKRAGGVAPTTLYLSHGTVAPGTASALFGDVPTWAFKWTGLDARAATVVATADGHTLKAFTN